MVRDLCPGWILENAVGEILRRVNCPSHSRKETGTSWLIVPKSQSNILFANS